ncbi:hypothetical protein SMICM17S_03616 [Streptomyces microflavus]
MPSRRTALALFAGTTAALTLGAPAAHAGPARLRPLAVTAHPPDGWTTARCTSTGTAGATTPTYSPPSTR